MVVLNVGNVEKFVTEQKALGNDVKWDGWDIVFFKRSFQNRGWNQPDGAFDRKTRNWGFQTRVKVNERGEWKVPNRNVKSS